MVKLEIIYSPQVIAFLKKEDASKDEEVSSLRASVRDLKHGAQKQWSTKEQQFCTNISELEEEVKQKDEEVNCCNYLIIIALCFFLSWV